MSYLHYCYLLIVVGTAVAGPITLGDTAGCCIAQSPQGVPLANCADYTSLGADRCNAVNQGKSCLWTTDCYSKCQRVSMVQTIVGVEVDIGRCEGACYTATGTVTTDLKCEAIYITKQLILGTEVRDVSVVASCECRSCKAIDNFQLIEINRGQCDGRCKEQNNVVQCKAGVEDNFDPLLNSPESSSPSAPFAAYLNQLCLSGITTKFDDPTYDRCFAHTFTCFERRSCPLRRALLHICIKGILYHTNTDYLILGSNGVSLWTLGLPILNDNQGWFPGSQRCFDLDLNNLPPGGNGVTTILSTVVANGNLDVAVNDDSMVDFVTLTLDYEPCQACMPNAIVNNILLTDSGSQTYPQIKSCDCFDLRECMRRPLFQTFFPGTPAQQTIDVGQCLGRCTLSNPSTAPISQRCGPKETEVITIPDQLGGKYFVSTIKSCTCL